MDITWDYVSASALPWLILFLVLSSTHDVTGEEKCPQGLIPRSQPWGGNVCCRPVRCEKGHYVQQCPRNDTAEICRRCSRHFNQSRRTSSFRKSECHSWPLEDDCRKKDTGILDHNDERTRECLCDVEKGMYFAPPEAVKGAPPEAFCQHNKGPKCKAGEEPTISGKCTKCIEGFFKSEVGFRLCEPKTDCKLMNLDVLKNSTVTTEDHVCSKPDPVTTHRPKVTEPVVNPPDAIKPKPPDRGSASSSTGAIPASSSTTAATGPDGSVRLGSSISTDQDHKGDDSDPNLGPILGSVCFLVIVVTVILVILFYRKHKGLAFCCGSTKTCSDPEKNLHHNPSLMAEPRQRKVMQGNCSSNNSSIVTGSTDKVINNNTSSNGRLPQYLVSLTSGDSQHEQRVNFQDDQVSIGGRLPPGPQNSTNHPRVRHTSFPGADHQVGDHQGSEQLFPPSNVFPPSPGRSQTLANVSPRPGILRNGGPSWKHAQAQAMDSIAREKLQVHMMGREANIEAGGENDPLLVTEGQNQFGARSVVAPLGPQSHFQNAPGNSATSASPPLIQGGMNQRYFLPHPLANNSSSVPEVTFAHQPSSGHPPKIVATFTRSSSVIATPEGEVDEDDMEARVPRFSQLLPDVDGADAAAAPDSSADREEGPEPRRPDETSGTTQQLRSPNQRLLPRATPGQGRVYQPAQPRTLRAPQASQQPDHHIMNLKEQQLQESLNSAPSSSLNSQLKFPSDVSETEALKTLHPADDEDTQTTLKTHVNPIEDSDFTGAAFTHAVRKAGEAAEPDLSEETEQKKQVGEVGGGGGSSTLERRRVQAARDRRRMASGGSTHSSSSSRSSTLERHRNPSSGDQPVKGSGDKTTTPNSDVPTAVKVLHSSSTVPFEEDEETGGVHGEAEDREQTQQKQVSSEGQTSLGSSTHSSEHSPSRASAYQRSQSENVSSGSESPHRPPPRSNSEEKPQSSNRPVAKVRPMPASDSPGPGKVSDEARQAPSAGNILSYSSEEDSDEEEADSSSRASSEVEATGTEDDQDEVTTQRGQGHAQGNQE